MAARQKILTLTGVMASPDPRDRLRLALMETRPLRGHRADYSWAELARRVPADRARPFELHSPEDGAADSAGRRGECWVELPRNKKRRARLLAYARGLVGREVELEVRLRPYTFRSQRGANRGEWVVGAALDFVSLEAVEPEM